MKKRAYSLLVTIIILFLLVGTAFFIRHRSKINLAQNNVRGAVAVAPTVEIIFTSSRRINGRTSANTVFAALETIAKENNLSLKTKNYDFGTLVEGIDGLTNTKEAFWMYQVNGKPGDKAADQFGIKPGDTIVWEYTKITQ